MMKIRVIFSEQSTVTRIGLLLCISESMRPRFFFAYSILSFVSITFKLWQYISASDLWSRRIILVAGGAGARTVAHPGLYLSQ